MTPYGMVADALYNIFGEGTPPPSALMSADDMLIKCARELDLEAPWYWLMGTRHFSVFSEMRMYSKNEVPSEHLRDYYVLPGHVYPFSIDNDPVFLTTGGPIDQKSFNETYKNFRGLYVIDKSIKTESEICTSELNPPDTEMFVSGFTVSGNMSKLKRIDREYGEYLLSQVPVEFLNGSFSSDGVFSGALHEIDVGGIIEKVPGSGVVVSRPIKSGRPESWFFGSDLVFSSSREPFQLSDGEALMKGEAFCLNVFPRPDKDYIIVGVGEIYTKVNPPVRSGSSFADEGSIYFGNGDLSVSNPVYEKTLVSLLTKNMATKFNYPAIALIYEREYMMTLDKLRSDNDRKLSYGLKLEYNDL